MKLIDIIKEIKNVGKERYFVVKNDGIDEIYNMHLIEGNTLEEFKKEFVGLFDYDDDYGYHENFNLKDQMEFKTYGIYFTYEQAYHVVTVSQNDGELDGVNYEQFLEDEEKNFITFSELKQIMKW